MPKTSILHTGNPRMDQFYHQLSLHTRESLGLNETEKFVVWVPTFRANHGVGVTKGWRDAAESAPSPNDSMTPVVSLLMAQGYTVVIKPHPQDRESRNVPHAKIVDNEDLSKAGTTFYSLLGAASGIITDYSSVWTEFLALDRPIGFVVPDRAQYEVGRGLYPADLFEWLPGPVLNDVDDISLFIQQLQDPSELSGQRARRRAVERLGIVHGNGRSTMQLLDNLDSKRVFIRSGGLRPDCEMTLDPKILLVPRGGQSK